MITRRHYLGLMSAAGATLFLPGSLEAAMRRRAVTELAFTTNPFTLGVASGDPTSTGFVMWTRLALAPVQADGGMDPVNVEVAWELATDSSGSALINVVRSGTALATPELAHSLHVAPADLPAGEYFFQFSVDGFKSDIGRAATLPAVGSLSPLRFAQYYCQSYEDGFPTVAQHLANEQVDFIVGLDDWIYENAPVAGKPRSMPSSWGTATTLNDMRRRFGLCGKDVELKAMRRSAMSLPTFDDHMIKNNWYGVGTGADQFLSLRAAAFQAWYENMPVRRRGLVLGSSDIDMYRRFRFGGLLELMLFDTRQFRDGPPCSEVIDNCPTAFAQARQMLGAAQEEWVESALSNTPALWQGFVNQVPFTSWDWRAYKELAEDLPQFYMDGWDGRAAARSRLMNMLPATPIKNPVFMTGDLHRGMAFNVPGIPLNPQSAPVGVEFVGSSATSGEDGRDTIPTLAATLAQNPHMKLLSEKRGYTVHNVSSTLWQTDFKTVPYITTPGAPLSTLKTFYVEPGLPELQE